MVLDGDTLMNYVNIVPSCKRITELLHDKYSLSTVIDKFGIHNPFYAVIFDTDQLKYYTKLEGKLTGFGLFKCWLVCSRTTYPNGIILVSSTSSAYENKYIRLFYNFNKVKESVVLVKNKFVFIQIFNTVAEADLFIINNNLIETVKNLSEAIYNIDAINFYTQDRIMLVSDLELALMARLNSENIYNSIQSDLHILMDTDYVVY